MQIVIPFLPDILVLQGYIISFYKGLLIQVSRLSVLLNMLSKTIQILSYPQKTDTFCQFTTLKFGCKWCNSYRKTLASTH